MMRFIDISNWQAGIDLPALFPQLDAVVVKATEGLNYVDKSCDKFVQQCKANDVPWGFYHFARNNNPVAEADYFINHTSNYFHHGIPVLDWEDSQTADWVNRFVRRIHDKTGVWPWIYANPWRFSGGSVERNCMRWVASYPNVKHPTFAQAKEWKAPAADGLVGAWQFCSDGRIGGYSGNLDCNLFYGTVESWNAYAGITDQQAETEHMASILENGDYKVTIERK